MISRFFLALCGYQARDGGEHEQATPSRLPIAAPVASLVCNHGSVSATCRTCVSALARSPEPYDHLPAFLRLLGES